MQVCISHQNQMRLPGNYVSFQILEVYTHVYIFRFANFLPQSSHSLKTHIVKYK